MIKYIILCLATILFGCVGEGNKPLPSGGVKPQITQEVVKPEPIAEKDSIDSLIELRAKQKFNHTIFAGLKFGDNPKMVKNALQNERNKKIRVPNGDKVSIIYIDSYDAEYYKSQLASLTLYAEEDELINPLSLLYSTKYGETKHYEWTFDNCVITIGCGWRTEYNIDRALGYKSASARTALYYESYRGERTSAITKDPGFLKITYKNLHLVKRIKRDKIIKDSLEQVKVQERMQAEKELAEKHRTEPATNI